MKHLISTTVFTLACMITFAQKPVKVLEMKDAMTKGTNPGMFTDIHQAELKEVRKEWGKLIKYGSKSKVEDDNGEISIQGAEIDIIHDGLINVYSRLQGIENGVRLVAFFEVENEFLSSETDDRKFEQAKKFVRRFSVNMYKAAVEEELKEEEKVLKDLRDDLKKLENEKDKLVKMIENNKRGISKANVDIEQNEYDQKVKDAEIENQVEVVDRLDGAIEDQQKDAVKLLKKMRNEKEKLEKQNVKYHENISKMEAEISRAERDIETNGEDQGNKNREIDQQKEIVGDVNSKLRRIK